MYCPSVRWIGLLRHAVVHINQILAHHLSFFLNLYRVVYLQEPNADYAEEDCTSDDDDYTGDEAALSDEQRAVVQRLLLCISLAGLSEELKALPKAEAGVARPRLLASVALAGLLSLMAAERTAEAEPTAACPATEPWISALMASGGSIGLGTSLTPPHLAYLVDHLPGLVTAMGVRLLQEVLKGGGSRELSPG